LIKREVYSRLLVKRVVKHYLKYDSENPFIFLAGILAFLGITAGVMVLMLAMGIMNGMQEEFQKRLFIMNYPLTITSYGRGVREETIKKIEERFPEAGISPYYTTQVIIKHGNDIEGCLLYGVNFNKESKINSIFAKATKDIKNPKRYSLIMGDDLSVVLGADIGSKVLLYFSKEEAIGFSSAPLRKHFSVAGIYNSGLNSYDKAILYTTTDAFVKLLKKDPHRYDGVHIFVSNPMEIIDDIKKLLPDDTDVEGWWQQNGNFFSAMEMEKKALFLVLLLIILVASLNIVSSLLMTIMSRRREIALLRTLGATKKEIYEIFFRLGIYIGLAGVVSGVVLALIGEWILKHFDIIKLPADVYGTTHLPIDMHLSDSLMIVFGAVIIILISSIYPARKASTTDPLTVLRNE